MEVLAMILAGGRGERLHPLTKDRAKPAVHFGGKYRIIDFVLSNLINSGIYSIYVLTQFKAQSFMDHLLEGWDFSGAPEAVCQNPQRIQRADPEMVAVFGADHIYKMNIHQMVEHPREKGAEAT